MSAALSSSKITHSAIPLKTACIEGPYRLNTIYAALNGWAKKANARDGRIHRLNIDFGDFVTAEKPSLNNYETIATNSRDVVAGKLGVLDRASNERFRDYKILAAYDKDGNLHGACMLKETSASVKGTDTRKVVAKVYFICAAFWDMPYNEPQNPLHTRGVGTALIKGAIDSIKDLSAIFAAPTEEGLKFFGRHLFIKHPTWKVTKAEDNGAVCGMYLYQRSFDDWRKLCSATFCEERSLPRPVHHCMEYLGGIDVVIAAIEKGSKEFKESKKEEKDPAVADKA